MKSNNPRWLVPAGILILGAIFLMLWAQNFTQVSANAPRLAPPFQGTAFEATLNYPNLLDNDIVTFENVGGQLSVVFSDTFEAGLDQSVWDSVDNNGVNFGEYKWDAEVYTPTAASDPVSVWAVGGGLQGSLLDPATDAYPDNADAWLILGPLDMSNVAEAMVTFTYWLQSDVNDSFGVSTSTDGVNFTGLETVSGGAGGFTTRTLGLNDHAGESNLYIAFIFDSDAVANAGNKGVFLDDVELAVRAFNKSYLPIVREDFTPTPSPTPTATPPSSGNDYRDDFTNSNSGWQMRRTDINSTNDWAISYRSNAPQTLQLSIESANEYLLASPFVSAPNFPYSVETRAKFYDMHDQHAFGIVFGGDWDGFSACPTNNFSSCFNHFYWLVVRYRTGTTPRIETELRYVNGFDASNQPNIEVVYSWVNPADFPNINVNPADWTSWKVELRANNTVAIYINGNLMDTITDNNLSNRLSGRPLFGLMSSVSSSGDSRQQFDLYVVKRITTQ